MSSADLAPSPERIVQQIPPYMVAHRGCRNEMRADGSPIVENTAEAFYRGIDAGANCVELDFRLTTDGKLVTSHGIEPHKHTSVSWTKEQPGSMTIEEVGAWAREINELNPDNKVDWLWEIKDTEIDMFKVVEQILGNGLEKNIKIISRHPGVIRDAMLALYAMGRGQDIEMGLLVPEATLMSSGQILDRVRPIGQGLTDVDWKVNPIPLFPKGFEPSQEFQATRLGMERLTEAAKREGLVVFTDAIHGDENDEASVKLLQAMANKGVESVTVDHPAILQKAFGVEPGKRVIPAPPDPSERNFKSTLDRDYLSSGYRKTDMDPEADDMTEQHRAFLKLSEERGIVDKSVAMKVLRAVDKHISAQ